MRLDLGRIAADAASKERVLSFIEAQTVAGYVRALSGIARARSGKGGNLGKVPIEALIEEALKLPAMRAKLAELEG